MKFKSTTISLLWPWRSPNSKPEWQKQIAKPNGTREIAASGLLFPNSARGNHRTIRNAIFFDMTLEKPSRSLPHRRTRENHANETAEDYVEAIFEIIEETGQCRVGNLVKHFDVSHVTVSRTVGRLQSEGLLETQPYKPITLTAAGIKLAKKMKKRHAVVFNFLLSLGVDRQTAQIDSEGIEHHVSDQTLRAMKAFTNR